MSMSMRVIGLRDPNSKEHQTNVAAVHALRAAKVWTLPKELADYFKTSDTNEAASHPEMAIEVKLGSAAREYKADMIDGFDVAIPELPKGVTVIRFYCSY